MWNKPDRIAERAADFCFASGYCLLINVHCHEPGILVPYVLLFTAIAVRFIVMGKSEP